MASIDIELNACFIFKDAEFDFEMEHNEASLNALSSPISIEHLRLRVSEELPDTPPPRGSKRMNEARPRRPPGPRTASSTRRRRRRLRWTRSTFEKRAVVRVPLGGRRFARTKKNCNCVKVTSLNSKTEMKKMFKNYVFCFVRKKM